MNIRVGCFKNQGHGQYQTVTSGNSAHTLGLAHSMSMRWQVIFRAVMAPGLSARPGWLQGLAAQFLTQTRDHILRVCQMRVDAQGGFKGLQGPLQIAIADMDHAKA